MCHASRRYRLHRDCLCNSRESVRYYQQDAGFALCLNQLADYVDRYKLQWSRSLEQEHRFLVLPQQNYVLCALRAVWGHGVAVHRHSWTVDGSLHVNVQTESARVPGRLAMVGDLEYLCLDFRWDTDLLLAVGVP